MLCIKSCFLTILFALMIPRPCSASQFLPPNRELTSDETIVHSVSAADAIVVGTILNSGVESLPSTRTSGAHSRWPWMKVKCAEWLKGEQLSSSTIRVYYSPEQVGGGINLVASRKGSGRVLFFLRRNPKAGEVKPLSAQDSVPEWEWSLLQAPDIAGHGWKDLEATESRDFAQSVLTARDVQRPESMVLQADIVAFVRPTGEMEVASLGGREVQVRRFAILSSDRPSADSIWAYPWVPGYGPRGDSVIFLRQIEDDVYEIMSSAAGSLPVRNGRVISLDEPVERFMGRMKSISQQPGR